jgi:hypothetical protein
MNLSSLKSLLSILFCVLFCVLSHATATRVSTRAGLLATALDEMAVKAMQRGVGSMDELAAAFRGTDAAIANVLESAGKCDLCLTRVETAIDGLKKERGLSNKEALEWIGDKNALFNSRVRGNPDNFVYSVLNICVGKNSNSRILEWCEKVIDWRVSGGIEKPPIPLFNCAGRAISRSLPNPACYFYPTYKDMKAFLEGTGFQGNHLNQNAAFKSVIPEADGIAHPLFGNAFRDIGSEHYIFHLHMENFWKDWRVGGKFFGPNKTPTLVEYNQALREALGATGLSASEVDFWVGAAEWQQNQYKTQLNGFVPRVPGRINQSY